MLRYELIQTSTVDVEGCVEDLVSIFGINMCVHFVFKQ